MVEPSPTPISCIVLNVWMNAYLHEKEEWEGKMIPQHGGAGGGQIGPSVDAQLR